MPSAKRLTIYSFGYWGWGNATEQLVRMMDVAEKARGNAPPFFVDARIRRTGRAPGFKGRNFETLVGCDRYLWEPRLGNLAIVTGEGWLNINDPSAAADLLDLAIDKAKKKQPVIFFCACEWPYDGEQITCHRSEIGRLLLKEAKTRKMSLSVVEWPGGEPKDVSYRIEEKEFKTLVADNDSGWYPVLRGDDWMDFAGLPWGSIIRVYSRKEDVVYAVGGYPVYKLNKWKLQLLGRAGTLDSAKESAKSFLSDKGMEPFTV